MPLQTPGAYPADSVMTRRCLRSAKLDGELTKDRPRLTTSSYQLLTLHSVVLTADVITQVRTVPGRYVIALLILFVLVPEPALSKPWSNMQPDHVIFRSRICQPLSVADLQKLMGPHYDQKKMAPDMATAKRTFDYTFEDSGNKGYQGDEPRVGITVDSADIFQDEKELNSEDDVWMYAREGDMYSDNGIVETIDDKEIMERRTWMPRRKILNRKLPDRLNNRRRFQRSIKNVYNNNNNFGDDQESKGPVNSFDSHLNISRRRRKSSDDPEIPSRQDSLETDKSASFDEDADENVNNIEYDHDGEVSEDSAKEKKGTLSSLHLRLHLNGNNRKMRRQLKKKFRQKGVNSNKPPPWECKFSQSTRHMKRGIFPDMLLEGRCETDKCFYRLYNCEPIKYAVKLLQRDPDQCNPMPNLGNVTVFEERWNLVQYHVTVGCSCTSPNVKNSKPKSRRRD